VPQLVGLGVERTVVAHAVDADALEPGPAQQGGDALTRAIAPASHA